MADKKNAELSEIVENAKREVVTALENLSKACTESDCCQEKIQKVYELIGRYGSYDGGHHKQWVLDQILQQTMTEEEYKAWLADYADGEDGPHTYAWDQGIAP